VARQLYRKGAVMSSKAKNAYGDYEYLRAAVQQKEHIESEYGVVVTAVIDLCRSPYVLRVHLEAYTKGEEAAQTSLCSYEVSWPNATVIGFAAQLFQAYGKLEDLVADSRRDYEKEWAFRQR
jgi:hypothetical protein